MPADTTAHGLHLMTWWAELNRELAERGEAEANYGDARWYHDRYWPNTAAALIAEDRAEKAAQLDAAKDAAAERAERYATSNAFDR
jgi:hypothetical protein